MEHKLTTYKTILYVTASAALGLIALSALWYANTYAKSLRPEAGWNTFTVSAEGKATGIPNIAQISFGVSTDSGKDMSAAQAENTKKMDDIMKFLDEQGVKKEDITTTGYNVSPRYQYFPCTAMSCKPAETVGYNISQSVSVKVRDISKAGGILSGVVSRGANNTSGPTFVIDDKDKLESQARGEAIAKARAKAETIADQGGFRIGKLLSVSDNTNNPGMYGMGGDMMSAAPMMAKESRAVSIEPGSQDVTVQVSVTYSIR